MVYVRYIISNLSKWEVKQKGFSILKYMYLPFIHCSDFTKHYQVWSAIYNNVIIHSKEGI